MSFPEPKPAATVVVMRESSRPSPSPDGAMKGESAGGPEILMVQRGRGAAFMADAWVFPGGRVDPADGEGDEAFARAAARELLEEAGLVVEASALQQFARWITPSHEPRRYDTRFFLVAAPAGEAQVDAREVVASRWSTPAALLADHEAGRIKLPPPTWATLDELGRLPSLEAARTWAAARSRDPILPKLVLLPENRLAIYLPWDPEYAAQPGDGHPLPADHPLAVAFGPRTRFVLEPGPPKADGSPGDPRWWARPPT